MIRWRQQGYHDDLSFHPVSRRCKLDKCAWSNSAQYCFWFLIFSRCGTIIYDLGNTNNLVSMVTQTASFCFRRCFIPWSSFSSHKPHTKAKGRGENTKNRDRKKRNGKKFSEIQRHAKKLIEISVGSEIHNATPGTSRDSSSDESDIDQPISASKTKLALPDSSSESSDEESKFQGRGYRVLLIRR